MLAAIVSAAGSTSALAQGFCSDCTDAFDQITIELRFVSTCDVPPQCNWSFAVSGTSGFYHFYGPIFGSTIECVEGWPCDYPPYGWGYHGAFVPVDIDSSSDPDGCAAYSYSAAGFYPRTALQQPCEANTALVRAPISSAWAGFTPSGGKDIGTSFMNQRGDAYPGIAPDCYHIIGGVGAAAAVASYVEGTGSGCGFATTVTIRRLGQSGPNISQGHFNGSGRTGVVGLDPSNCTVIRFGESGYGVGGATLGDPNGSEHVWSSTGANFTPAALANATIITVRDDTNDLNSDGRFTQADVNLLVLNDTDPEVLTAYDYNRSGAIDASDIALANSAIAAGLGSGTFGDADGNGFLSTGDQVAAAAAWGAMIYDSNYNIRVDFDLDGDNDTADETAFDALSFPLVCDSIDFNNDTSFFDPQDYDAFISVYGDGPCLPSTATCNDIDFNNDGSTYDPCDIDSFLNMMSEGPCTTCGV